MTDDLGHPQEATSLGKRINTAPNKSIRRAILGNIPDELNEYSQWVGWRGVIKDGGKLDKIPVNPKTGRNAKTNDPATWGTFKAVVSYYGRNRGGGACGIGFVFTKNDPFCGIDLDNCYDPETGQISEWAEEILKKIDSYSEISPSNKGIKIFAKGRLPGGGKKKGKIEIYDSRRFFTVTGGRLGLYPKTVEDRKEEVVELYNRLNSEPQKETPQVEIEPLNIDDKEVLEKARNSKNRDKFDRLWTGDWSEYPSQSEADSALCHKLVFWCGNNSEQIDRLFRQSGLMRSKWDEKHYADGRTYGQITVEKAIANTKETYISKKTIKQKRAQVLNLDDLEDCFEGDISWLWRNHVPKAMPIILNGREGTGKTSIAIQIANEILENHQKGVVVWIASEGFVQDTHDKMKKLGVDRERFLLARNKDGTFRFNFAMSKDLTSLVEVLSDLNAPILAVFIDSIRGITPYEDTDSRIKNPMMNLNAIICDKYKASLIYIHHFKKGKEKNLIDRSTGPTAIASSVRVVFSVMPVSKYKREILLAKSNIFSADFPKLEAIQVGNNIIINETETNGERTESERCERFLIELFRKQNKHLASDVYARGEQKGFSGALVKKLKGKLGITSKRIENSWQWIWSL